MKYTVRQLAKISGVSVRTLHWYDKKGLLKPSARSENNYRYYDKDKLLRLQQILFFKELDFSLNDIEKLLSQSDFDTLQALKKHKAILAKEIKRQKQLIKTIDKTILHLGDEQVMTSEELYFGFDSNKQKEYEQYIVKSHDSAEEHLLESKKRTAKWTAQQWAELKQQGDLLHKELAKAIDNELDPFGENVQKLIARHYEMQNQFFDVTKDVYIGLTTMYAEHPDFRKFFDVYHPDLVEYIGKAMRYYANRNL